MAVRSVKQPFPPFGDVDGNPLENGYIYVGTIDLDPVTNPISVYWDADLTVPAVQPIRTIGGYPSNNGTPGALYADDEYSITIKNKNLTLVATSPSPTVEINVATSTKIGGVKSGGGISVDPVGAVTIVNDSHTHDTQYVIITPEVLAEGQDWDGVDIGGGETLYPSGMIYGTNAQGTYEKRPDGTLICFSLALSLDANVASGTGYISTTPLTWTFPFPFIDTLYISTGNSYASYVFDVGFQSPTTTTVSVSRVSFGQDGSVRDTYAKAHGRWKA